MGRATDRAAATAAWLVTDLLTQDAILAETHFAWTLVGPRDVWKIKKPIAFGDLDCTTLPLRREACEAEIRRNRVLAADVYHGFVPITVDGHGRHRFGGPGRPVEWAIHMRRLPDRASAACRLAENRLSIGDLESVAARLADFHLSTEFAVDPSGHGSARTLEKNVRCHAEWARRAIGHLIKLEECKRIEGRQLAFLDRHAKLLAERIEAGRVRDIHGDMRLDHVYSDHGQIVIVDRLELGPRFCVVDVAADVAMLALGLEDWGQMALASAFVTAFVRQTGDRDTEGLIGFYGAYYACQRACLLASLALDRHASSSARVRAAQGARRCFTRALATIGFD